MKLKYRVYINLIVQSYLFATSKMSKKYVPSFIKEQTTVPSNTVPSVRTFVNNKFEALSDDFSMTKNTPVINTSLPAKLAPKLAPATLASITSNGTVSVTPSSLSQQGGPKKSFASKFSEQAKIASNPNYKPPPKVIDVNSADEFPTLGAPKNVVTKTVSNISAEYIKVDKPPGLSFAEKAKEWAQQKQDEVDEANRKAIEEENKRCTAALNRGIGCIGMKRFKNNTNHSVDEDEDYNYEESSLGDDDSFEVPEQDEEPSSSEDDENDNEINQNVGWDGRRKGDLY